MIALVSVSSTVAGAGIAVGVGLVGTVVSARISSKRDLRLFRLDTALEMADTVSLYDDYTDAGWRSMTRAPERLDVRLQVSGVPADLRTSLRQIEQACWRDNLTSVEMHDEPGVDLEKVNANRDVREAVGRYLTHRGSAKSRRTQEDIAIQKAKAANPRLSQD
jgi:hypothetical protein